MVISLKSLQSRCSYTVRNLAYFALLKILRIWMFSLLVCCVRYVTFKKISKGIYREWSYSMLAGFCHSVLSRDPTSAFIFWISSSVLLWGLALTFNSETPHTKSKGLQSGELGGLTSFSQTSGRFSSWICRGPWQWSPLGLRPGLSICSRCASCAFFVFFRFQQILQKQNFRLTSFIYVWWSFWCLHAHNLFHGSSARSLETAWQLS
jgi:hypothetical protein